MRKVIRYFVKGKQSRYTGHYNARGFSAYRDLGYNGVSLSGGGESNSKENAKKYIIMKLYE